MYAKLGPVVDDGQSTTKDPKASEYEVLTQYIAELEARQRAHVEESIRCKDNVPRCC